MFLFILLVFLCSQSAGIAQGTLTTVPTHYDTTASGEYSGSVISDRGLRFLLIVHLRVFNNGTIQATYDVPDRQAYGLRFTNASIYNSRLQLVNDSADAYVEGLFDAHEGTIDGTWIEKLSRSPVRLRKNIAPVRFQQSSLGLNYVVQHIDVTDSGHMSGRTATLILPDTIHRWPLFILISDHGYQDQDATDQTGHKPFLVMAQMLARRHWASLRCEDRKDEAEYDDDSLRKAHAADMLRLVEQIRNNNNIDTSRIFIIGHGEGGLVGALVSMLNPSIVRGIVCAATPAVPGVELLPEMVESSERLYGTDENVVAVAVQLLRSWMNVVASIKDLTKATQRIAALADSVVKEHEELVTKFPVAARLMRLDRDEYINETLYPWLYSYAVLNPTPILSKIPVPFLALMAERDVHVPSKQNLSAWQAIPRLDPRSDVRLVVGVNHNFQSCDDCTLEEASTNPETIKIEVLWDIVEWADRVD
ncbi:MAG: alpha/beta hydrolase [Ignavibacteria bacterium]|nr:alpha/beta hydrolase [Ignavibacteria bacterium]